MLLPNVSRFTSGGEELHDKTGGKNTFGSRDLDEGLVSYRRVQTLVWKAHSFWCMHQWIQNYRKWKLQVHLTSCCAKVYPARFLPPSPRLEPTVGAMLYHFVKYPHSGILDWRESSTSVTCICFVKFMQTMCTKDISGQVLIDTLDRNSIDTQSTRHQHHPFFSMGDIFKASTHEGACSRSTLPEQSSLVRTNDF